MNKNKTINNLKKNKVVYKKVFIWFHKRKRKKYSASTAPILCSLCKKEIKENETMYMIITNNILFPNTNVHETCVNSWYDTCAGLKIFSDGKWIGVMRLLENDYNQAKYYRDHYTCWFENS